MLRKSEWWEEEEEEGGGCHGLDAGWALLVVSTAMCLICRVLRRAREGSGYERGCKEDSPKR